MQGRKSASYRCWGVIDPPFPPKKQMFEVTIIPSTKLFSQLLLLIIARRTDFCLH